MCARTVRVRVGSNVGTFVSTFVLRVPLQETEANANAGLAGPPTPTPAPAARACSPRPPPSASGRPCDRSVASVLSRCRAIERSEAEEARATGW